MFVNFGRGYRPSPSDFYWRRGQLAYWILPRLVDPLYHPVLLDLAPYVQILGTKNSNACDKSDNLTKL